jgi:transposase
MSKDLRKALSVQPAARVRHVDPFSVKALRFWGRSQVRCDEFVRSMLPRKVKRLLAIHEEVKELEKELEQLLEFGGYTIQTASGCGPIVAATIVGEIGEISRFNSPAALAKYAGCAPRELSSGKHHRYVKTRAGNRRLTSAFHHMALSQISRMGNEKARTYFQKKISEGKSKAQALVCLRRHIVNVIWCMMTRREVYRIA